MDFQWYQEGRCIWVDDLSQYILQFLRKRHPRKQVDILCSTYHKLRDLHNLHCNDILWICMQFVDLLEYLVDIRIAPCGKQRCILHHDHRQCLRSSKAWYNYYFDKFYRKDNRYLICIRLQRNILISFNYKIKYFTKYYFIIFWMKLSLWIILSSPLINNLRLKHCICGSPAKFCLQWQVGWWLTVRHSAFRPHWVLTHGFWHNSLIQASLGAQSRFDVHSGNESVSATNMKILLKNIIFLLLVIYFSFYKYYIFSNYLCNNLQMDHQQYHANNDIDDNDFGLNIPHSKHMDW